MEFNLTRPNYEQPFKYLLELDEEFLLHVMAGLDRVYSHIDQTLALHTDCDRLSPTGCRTDAGSCFDVLVEAHGTMLSLAEFMKEARFVRENREAKSLESFQQLRREARAVVETAARTMLPTAQYPTLGPMGTCPREEGKGQDLATRTQKVILPDLFTEMYPSEAPVEAVGDTRQIQDPQSDN